MLKKTGKTLFILFLICTPLWAFSFRSEIDRNQTALNEPFTLSIIFEDDGQNELKEWSLPELKDFQVVAKSTAQEVHVINGQMSRQIRLNFVLSPYREGDFVLPVFEYPLKNNLYKTDALKVVITKAVPKPRHNAGPVMQTFTSLPTFFNEMVTADPVYLETGILDKEIYVGEKIGLNYLFIHKGRFFEGPNFYAPQATGLRLKNLNQFTGPQARTKIIKNNSEFWSDRLSFIVSPLTGGRFEIKPARIEYRQSPYEELKKLESEKILITAHELPRPVPKNFSGAVGQFEWQWAEIPSQKYFEGETIVLKVKIWGKGNLDPVNIFGTNPETPQENIDSEGIVRSEKIFNYQVTLDHSGEFLISYPEFVYFDPHLKKYATLKMPSSLKIWVLSQKSQGLVVDLNPPSDPQNQKSNGLMVIGSLLLLGLGVGGGTYFYLRSQKPFEKLQRKYQKVLNKSNDFDLVYQYLRDYYLLIHGQSLDGLALAQIKDETVQKIIQVIEEQKYSTAANKKATDLRPWLDLLKPKN
jgi:hypothetical protein